MTFSAREVAVGTTATPIGTAAPNITHELTIGNDYNKTIYLGGPDVAIGGGYSVPKNVSVVLRISNGDVLYAISDAADSNLHIFDYQVHR